MILTSPQALSIEFEDGLFPELVVSGRALGMGNAFVSKVDDESSPFYNPAGLGTVRGWTFHLSNISAEVNKDLSQNMTQGEGSSSTGAKVTDSFDLDGLRQIHRDNPGFVSHSRVALAPNITRRFFSAGYLYSRRTRAALGTGTESQFEFADRTDHGPYTAINVSIFGGVLKLGATATWLFRKEQKGTRDKDAELVIGPEESRSGRALMVTSGAKLTLPIYALPTFSAVIHNTGGKDFNQSSNSQFAPDKIQQNIVLGFSLTPQLGKTTRVHLEANFKDAGNRYDNLDSGDRWQAGIEFDFFRTIFVRGGFSQGKGAGGLGIRIRDFRMDLSTYAVDVDTEEAEGLSDRRFSLGFSGGF